MTPESLRAYAEGCPAGYMVPVPRELILEILGGAAKVEPITPRLRLDLTLEEAGVALHKSPVTIRAYCRANLLPGSYRMLGRSWRVPPAAIEAFQASEQRAHLKRAS